MIAMARFLVTAATCAWSLNAQGVQPMQHHLEGLVLIQRQAEPVSSESASDNFSEPDDFMDLMSAGVQNVDTQLQRKAAEHSREMASMESSLEAKLKAEQKVLAAISRQNTAIQKSIEQSQKENSDLRKQLNETKENLKHVSDNLRSFAGKLVYSNTDLDMILQHDEEVATVHNHSSPQESLLEIESQPVDSFDSLQKSFSKMHSKLEENMSAEFNKSFDDLELRKESLISKQKALNITLIVERQHSDALSKQLHLLKKLSADLSANMNGLNESVEAMGDTVSHSKIESSETPSRLLSTYAVPDAVVESEARPQGFFKNAMRAAGAKIAGAFAGGMRKTNKSNSTSKRAVVVHSVNSKAKSMAKSNPKQSSTRPVKSEQAKVAAPKPAPKSAPKVTETVKNVEVNAKPAPKPAPKVAAAVKDVQAKMTSAKPAPKPAPKVAAKVKNVQAKVFAKPAPKLKAAPKIAAAVKNVQDVLASAKPAPKPAPKVAAAAKNVHAKTTSAKLAPKPAPKVAAAAKNLHAKKTDAKPAPKPAPKVEAAAKKVQAKKTGAKLAPKPAPKVAAAVKNVQAKVTSAKPAPKPAPKVAAEVKNTQEKVTAKAAPKSVPKITKISIDSLIR